jgi:hypothetical protein
MYELGHAGDSVWHSAPLIPKCKLHMIFNAANECTRLLCLPQISATVWFPMLCSNATDRVLLGCYWCLCNTRDMCQRPGPTCKAGARLSNWLLCAASSCRPSDAVLLPETGSDVLLEHKGVANDHWEVPVLVTGDTWELWCAYHVCSTLHAQSSGSVLHNTGAMTSQPHNDPAQGATKPAAAIDNHVIRSCEQAQPDCLHQHLPNCGAAELTAHSEACAKEQTQCQAIQLLSPRPHITLHPPTAAMVHIPTPQRLPILHRRCPESSVTVLPHTPTHLGILHSQNPVPSITAPTPRPAPT